MRLEARGLGRSFGPVRALQDVDFHVEAGEVLALVGENGAGKTTLVRCLSGFLAPDEGTFLVDGNEVRFAGPGAASAAGVGLVHQHFLLAGALTVAENVVLGDEPGSGALLDASAMEREVRELGDALGLPVDPAARVDTLSVALRQRVEVLRVLRRGARCILLDEPTGLLAPEEAKGFLRFVTALADEGRSVVLITHRLQEAVAVAHRAVVLREGRVVATVAGEDLAVESLGRAMVGDAALPDDAVVAGFPAEVLLRASAGDIADDLGRMTVKDVSVDVRCGEIVGLAGVAGSGAREFLEVVAGVRGDRQCAVSIGGIETGGRGVSVARAAGVAFVPEDRETEGLIPGLPASENVLLPRLVSGRGGDAVAGPFLLPGALRKAATPLMQHHGVRPADPDAPPSFFSGGNRQKLLLAREMGTEPRLLVAAEPFRGMDLAATAAARAKFVGFRDAGGAVLLSSGNLEELLRICDRLVVLCGGRVVRTFDRGEADEESLGLAMGGVVEVAP